MTGRVRLGLFFTGFAVLALLLAGVVSYFADSNPDGLDAATQRGCTVVEEQLEGNCIAQRAEDHSMATSPLAEYALGGDDRFTGVAGVLGVVVTLGVAVGLFTLLRKRSRS